MPDADRLPFLRTIRDLPKEDAPRLVYADWMEERGETLRAELIRVGCEVAIATKGESSSRPPDSTDAQLAASRRLDEIHRRHGGSLWSVGYGLPIEMRTPKIETASWADAKPHHTTGPIEIVQPEAIVTDRGLVTVLTCSWAYWAKHADAVLANQPVERVTVTTPVEVEWVRQATMTDEPAKTFTEWKFAGVSPYRSVDGLAAMPMLPLNAGGSRKVNVSALLGIQWAGVAFTLQADPRIGPTHVVTDNAASWRAFGGMDEWFGRAAAETPELRRIANRFSIACGICLDDIPLEPIANLLSAFDHIMDLMGRLAAAGADHASNELAVARDMLDYIREQVRRHVSGEAERILTFNERQRERERDRQRLARFEALQAAHNVGAISTRTIREEFGLGASSAGGISYRSDEE